MSNDPTSKIITTVVDGFVKEGKMFSAYDVTSKIRGMGIYCKHDAVKADIHSAMADVIREGSEDYMKTLVDTGSYRTFVYHKTTDNAHSYNQTNATQVAGMVNTVKPVAPAPAPAPVAPVQTLTVKRDSRGRVCLSADMLRSIGATSGKMVVISPKSGEVVVSKWTLNVNVPKTDHIYTVDRDNNVRISAGVFAKAKLGTANSFNVSQGKNSITVY